MKENKVTQAGGLSLDSSLITQPEGSTRFALNAVNETDEGDLGYRTNEESNEACYTLPVGFSPLSSLYIGEDKTLLFLASSTGNSALAIVDSECNLEVIVNDSNQTDKFKFNISHQISSTFRLRRGCERVVYWTDPKPRSFVIDKPEKYKDALGNWNISKFNLFKLYSKIPKFENIEVVNSGGVLAPGSYNVSVQYLDEDLNPTEFTTSSEVVKIYNDSFENDYTDIRGSVANSTSTYIANNTNKSIKITLSDLDLDFPFYRLAFTEATNGSGQISDTKYTSEISTRNPVFIYTGANFETSGTQQDIIVFNNIIDSAEHIEQIENKLILSNVKGKQINFCALQRYASRIQADCILTKIPLNTLGNGNGKKASPYTSGTGYTPGEIHSFGIVYVFDDMTLTPVYHIPGKNPNLPVGSTFLKNENGKEYYPMSLDNQSLTTRYIDNNSCDNLGSWGLDSEGEPLKNELVRHHRFPLRSEINKPLFTEVIASQTSTEFHTLRIRVNGEISFPPPCITDETDPEYDPNCVEAETIEYSVEYVANGENLSTTQIIEYSNWDDLSTPGQEVFLNPVLTGQPITITSVKENGIAMSPGVPSPTTGLTYTIDDVPYIAETEGKLYFSEVMNIEFSNIIMPSLEDTNGQKIIGYYIVRNERTENEKTILDSGVLTSTMQNAHFVSHGLLMPDFSNANNPKIKKDFLGLINPEFKFNNKTYTEVDEIIKQGEYKPSELGALYSNVLFEDTLDGSSYESKRHKKSESDNDGFSLRIRTKDNILLYKTDNKLLFGKDDIKEIFYLDALTYKNVEDSSDIAKDVFNVSADNKIGIVSLNSNFDDPIINTLPYVILKRNIADPYSNFRTLPYYKESRNMVPFINEQISQTRVANGDSYVTSMKYVNSLFYENRIRQRRTKGGLLSIILGSLIIVAGVIGAFFTAGASLALISLGAAAISGGALLAASGIKQANWNKVYNELYKEGLRETIEDDFLNDNFKAVNPPDDEIRWFGEALTNLWFESSVNMSLRHGNNVGSIPDFIDSPAIAETGNGNSGPVTPGNSLDRHLVSKLTVINQDRKGGREYIGVALPEIYQINADYYRMNKQKIFNHLPLEYDCCSDCRETFPHRTHWSEESFQEELTDNYRTFLPNNYRDIEGNTGAITDVFRIQNNLYIHTEEALWHLPQVRQERITGDILSFLGTGEFFSVPPRKIVDDENSSAGTSHKWARIKTKHGVLFPSHKEKKWYLFNGESLKPISDASLSNYFKENMDFKVVEDYYKSNKTLYPFSDNPSNPIGVGYLSTYDTKKERFIITKKDFQVTNNLGTDYELCSKGGATTIFNNFSQTLLSQQQQGFQYLGIEDCRLKFQKTILEDKIEKRIVTTTEIIRETIASNTVVIPFFDTTSMPFNVINNISATLDVWFPVFKASVNNGNNSITFLNPGTWNRWGTEDWVKDVPQIVLDQIGVNKNVLLLVFVDEVNPGFHESNFNSSLTPPTATYISSASTFVNTLHNQFASFTAINYPIVQNNNNCREYLQHAIAAIEAKNMSVAEVDALVKNPFFSDAQWATLKTNLQSNSYVGQPILKNYGWLYKENRVTDPALNSSVLCPSDVNAIITPCQFTEDIKNLLQGDSTTEEVVTTVEEIDVVVKVPRTIYSFVEGAPINLVTLNNSWTMSYSLKEEKWISWHSYLPSFYFRVQEKFYSWKQKGASIWRHNRKNHYQTFYGEYHPFIIEYVDTYGLQTAVCDGITMQTEAKQYNELYEEFIDKQDITFNKILVYNTTQTSGVRNMIVKSEGMNYLFNQIKNSQNDILISRNERNWNVNELRNLRTDYDIPMFTKKLADLQNRYFIDKILNVNAIDENKGWSELESFRDKFLVVRLIFDTFDNTRLTMNFSTQDNKASER